MKLHFSYYQNIANNLHKSDMSYRRMARPHACYVTPHPLNKFQSEIFIMQILSWNSPWMFPTCWATHFHKEQTFTEFRVFHYIFVPYPFKSKSDVFKLSGGENLNIFRSKKIFLFRSRNCLQNFISISPRI